jgi:hypothetical protein
MALSPAAGLVDLKLKGACREEKPISAFPFMVLVCSPGYEVLGLIERKR